MKYQHIVFDIDGSLIHTEHAILHSLLVCCIIHIWQNYAEYSFLCKADFRRRSGGYG